MITLILIAVSVFAYIAGVMSAINWSNKKHAELEAELEAELANELERQQNDLDGAYKAGLWDGEQRGYEKGRNDA